MKNKTNYYDNYILRVRKDAVYDDIESELMNMLDVISYTLEHEDERISFDGGDQYFNQNDADYIKNESEYVEFKITITNDMTIRDVNAACEMLMDWIQEYNGHFQDAAPKNSILIMTEQKKLISENIRIKTSDGNNTYIIKHRKENADDIGFDGHLIGSTYDKIKGMAKKCSYTFA